ncbi:MAG TPA: hypothetical protein VM432_05770, partial [Bdellovibrionales bacterium]|nr:hypothetical protein [Bdellovibrionales bacterium]
AKTLALVGCTIPSVGEAVKSLSDFKRVVFIRSCAGDAKPSLHLASLARGGVFGFASMNPSAEFIQFRPQAMALAMKRGELSIRQQIDDLISDSTKSRLLGLDRSTWMQDLNAFRVSGAIEAVEWYRFAAKGT